MIIKRIDGATRTIGKQQGYLGLPLRDEDVDLQLQHARAKVRQVLQLGVGRSVARDQWVPA